MPSLFVCFPSHSPPFVRPLAFSFLQSPAGWLCCESGGGGRSARRLTSVVDLSLPRLASLRLHTSLLSHPSLLSKCAPTHCDESLSVSTPTTVNCNHAFESPRAHWCCIRICLPSPTAASGHKRATGEQVIVRLPSQRPHRHGLPHGLARSLALHGRRDAIGGRRHTRPPRTPVHAHVHFTTHVRTPGVHHDVLF